MEKAPRLAERGRERACRARHGRGRRVHERNFERQVEGERGERRATRREREGRGLRSEPEHVPARKQDSRVRLVRGEGRGVST